MSEKGTEQATPQRKKKAREEGDVVRSRELLSAAAMLGGVLALGLVSAEFVKGWRRVYKESLSTFAIADLSGQRGLEAVHSMVLPVLVPMAIVMGAAFGGSLLVGVAQSGGIALHPKLIAFKPDRLNPVTNLGNLFSLRSTTRVLKSLVPAGAMALFGWHELKALVLPIPVMSLTRLPETLSTAYRLAFDAAWVTLAWSGFDYAMEWRAWNQRLRMTRQELREEARDATGNPQIKARVRQIQRAMRRRRMKADISRASVVITNPTHYAVALEFSFETMQAPTVLAKGRDLHAAAIREEARWAGVPLVENPPLARSLYQSVEEGHSIPFELYQAVAGILAFLYRQRVEEKMRAERQARTEAVRIDARADTRSPARTQPGTQTRTQTRTPAGTHDRSNFKAPNFTPNDEGTRDESTGAAAGRARRDGDGESQTGRDAAAPGGLPRLAGPVVEGAAGEPTESAGGAI